jgi:hypothetical protein
VNTDRKCYCIIKLHKRTATPTYVLLTPSSPSDMKHWNTILSIFSNWFSLYVNKLSRQHQFSRCRLRQRLIRIASMHVFRKQSLTLWSFLTLTHVSFLTLIRNSVITRSLFKQVSDFFNHVTDSTVLSLQMLLLLGLLFLGNLLITVYVLRISMISQCWLASSLLGSRHFPETMHIIMLWWACNVKTIP